MTLKCLFFGTPHKSRDSYFIDETKSGWKEKACRCGCIAATIEMEILFCWLCSKKDCNEKRVCRPNKSPGSSSIIRLLFFLQYFSVYCTILKSKYLLKFY